MARVVGHEEFKEVSDPVADIRALFPKDGEMRPRDESDKAVGRFRFGRK